MKKGVLDQKWGWFDCDTSTDFYESSNDYGDFYGTKGNAAITAVKHVKSMLEDNGKNVTKNVRRIIVEFDDGSKWVSGVGKKDELDNEDFVYGFACGD